MPEHYEGKPVAYIFWGISGSGKSTMASVFPSYTEINRDNIRFTEILTPENSWDDWDWKWEPLVTKIWKTKLDWAVANMDNLVISDTNLNRNSRINLMGRLEKSGYDVRNTLLWITPEIAKKRNKARSNPIPDEAIDRQYEKLCREGWDESREFVMIGG